MKPQITQISQIKTKFFLVWAVWLVLWGMSTTAVFAAPTNNVTLTTFSATQQEDAVLLAWTTATELDTIGFRLQVEIDGAITPLDKFGPHKDGFIPAEGSPTLGAAYSVVDDTAVYGQTINYQLLEQTMNGTTVMLSNVTISPIAAATPTPFTLPPTQPPVSTQTPHPTNTAVPPTQPPAATEPPASTETSVPTNMPPETAVPPTLPPPSPIPTMTNTTAQIASNPIGQADIVSDNMSASLIIGVEPARPAVVQDSTPEAGYPSPPTPMLPEANEAYPVTSPVPTPLLPTPYPVDTTNENNQPTPTGIAIIGDAPPETEFASQLGQTNPVESGSGRLFLWGGFLIGMLIFITAVLGAIMLFTRRNGQ